MKTRTINDFAPEVKSLLHTLKAHGFAIRAVTNDGESFTQAKDVSPEAFLEEIMACDEASLRVTRTATRESTKTPGTQVYCRYGLYLVFGNSPGELVADWNIPANADDAAALEAACKEHGDRWDGKKQPTREV